MVNYKELLVTSFPGRSPYENRPYTRRLGPVFYSVGSVSEGVC